MRANDPRSNHKSLCIWASVILVVVLLIVMALCFPGCATLQSLTQTHFKTFELTIDNQKISVNLPNELPSLDEAINAGEACFNTKVCRQRFCVTEDLGHDHVDFVYIDTDVIAVVWVKTNETEFEKRFVAWIYIEGTPISAPITRIQDLVKEHDPNQ